MHAAVNLCARHFASPQLSERISNCLRDSHVIPGAVQLEIADPVASANPDHTAAVLAQLLRLGVTKALDDFGSNAIWLASLRRSSYDVLKIDRSLILGMQADRASLEVVNMILTLARQLHCEVVAEGLEKPKQFETLRSMGCGLAQGYFFSSPLDSKTALQRLRKLQPPASVPLTN